ncbi:MAG: carboxymuconolactone decarboxylase family protein [Bacteroidia bacterium]
MIKRISIKEIEPDAYKAMYELENYTKSSELSLKLRELIKIRASQINKCTFCIDMHTKAALVNGESKERIFELATWKESGLFTAEEKCALQLTEEITLIPEWGVKEETYDSALALFGDKKTAQLIMQVVVINSWNRIAVSTKMIFK